MSNYEYVLEDSGREVDRGRLYREADPKVGEPLFGTPDAVWVISRVEPALMKDIAATVYCSPVNPNAVI